MKMRGGYLPKIAGRPSRALEELAVPCRLHVDLCRQGLRYEPLVKDGERVAFGQALGEAEAGGGRLVLPSPGAGEVFLERGADSRPERIVLETAPMERPVGDRKVCRPDAMTPETIRDTLIEKGIWGCFRSSVTGGAPAAEPLERPRAVIVTGVLSEPFRAGGDVVLQRWIDYVLLGLEALPRLMAANGTVTILMAGGGGEAAGQKLVSGVAGQKHVRIERVPARYPIENPVLLRRLLRRDDPSIAATDAVWVTDLQGVAAIGVCRSEGLPLYQRIIAVGGPGLPNPRHVLARVGTPVAALLHDVGGAGEGLCVLRGGLLRGERVDLQHAAVGYDDDAYFFMEAEPEREFLSFVRPGIDRTSILPCFLTTLTRGADAQVCPRLRGEPRACVSCGLCEAVCPAGLMPQVLHRALFQGEKDEADAAGLGLCVECGLCTFVCPCKIELEQQFVLAKEELRREKAEAAGTAGGGAGPTA